MGGGKAAQHADAESGSGEAKLCLSLINEHGMGINFGCVNALTYTLPFRSTDPFAHAVNLLKVAQPAAGKTCTAKPVDDIRTAAH